MPSSPRDRMSPRDMAPSPMMRQATCLTEVAADAALLKVMKLVPWLKTLRDPELTRLALRGTQRKFKRYATVTRGCAERTLSVHVVMSGKVHTEQCQTGLTAIAGPGESCGEAALVTGVAHWPEIVTCEVDTTLLQFALSDFEGFPIDYPLLRQHAIAHYLSTVYYFRDLPPQKRLAVASLMSFASMPQYAVIFSRGQAADHFYILVEGKVGMYREHRGMHDHGAQGGSGLHPRGGGLHGAIGLNAGAAAGMPAPGPPPPHQRARMRRRRSTLSQAGKPFLEFKGGADLNRGDETPPWFGLTAVAEKTTRNATALASEKLLMLQVPAANFRAFCNLLSGFLGIAGAGANTFRTKEKFALE